MVPGIFHSFQREVESIQNLSITVNAGSANGTVSPSPAVDWDRTVIMVRGWVNGFGGGVDLSWPAASFYLDLSGSDVRLNRAADAGAGNTTCYFTLVQFRPGVIRRIQRGTITNAGVGTNTFALSAAVELDKIDLHFLMALLTENESQAFSRVEMLDASTVRHIGGSSTATAIASFEAVERY